jgi:hypothetical protein
MTDKTHKLLNTFVAGVLAFYFCIHWIIILRTGVDIPYWDEWSMLNPGALSSKFNWSWIWRHHVDHRIVLTKLQIWLLYRINGWNLVSQMAMNFLIYGALIGTLFQICRKTAPTLPRWLLGLFTSFCLSTLPAEGHVWAFESQYHFALLFSLLALYFLFRPRQKIRHLLWALFFGGLSMFSLASGIVTTLSGFFIFSIFKFLRSRQSQKRELLSLSIAALFFLGLIFVWSHNFVKPWYLPARIYPHHLEFWNFFVNLVSFGFGFQKISATLGLFCLFLVSFPLLILFLRNIKNPDPKVWLYGATVFGVLMTVVVVSIGRAGWGLSSSKTIRYSEFGLLLVPLTAVGWWNVLAHSLKLRTIVITLLFLFFSVSFLDDWSFKYYYETQTERLRTVQCVKEYYQKNQQAECAKSFSPETRTSLIRAKELNISFYRKALEIP